MKFSNDEKQEVLTWRSTLLRQVKSCIDNDLKPATVSVTDPTKNNFTQLMNIKELLDGLEMSEGNYYRALSISKNEHLVQYFKREPNFCFDDNCFHVGLRAWQSNMDIQSVFNEYMAVRYILQCFLKAEDKYLLAAMKQAAKPRNR